MSVRIQEKFTLPFACLVFGLIGSSLGSKQNLRTSKSQGFGLSVILICSIMYFLFYQAPRRKRYTNSIYCSMAAGFDIFFVGIYLLKKAS